jgi:outer membrane receptor protein involved in Fe transport
MQGSNQLLKNGRMLSRLMAGAGIAALAAGALSGTAFAAAPAASANDETTVIVTAQKREQRLQDVPIVVTTLSAKLLQDAGVHDIKDMQILTPGLIVTSTQNESLTTARIRGVGTVGDNPGLESSVGIVIDGVYRPRNGVGFEDLGEMERIEVLKGPQGTLFGKNTSAGVINIITKKPSFTFGGEGEATIGNFGAYGLGASVTGPIVADKIAGRLYVARRKHDGYTSVNVAGGPRTEGADQDQDFDTVRGQLLFVPNDLDDIRVIGDYTHRTENCCVAVQTRTGPTAAAINALASGGAGVAATANPDNRLAYSNRATHQVVSDGGISVEGNFKLPDFHNSTLTSITGLRDWKSTNGQDLDYSGADLLYRKDNGDFDARFKTLSQEFRLAGGGDKVNWLVGAFFSKEDLDRHDSYVYGSAYENYLGLLLAGKLAPTAPLSTQLTLVSALTGVPTGSNFAPGAQARDHYTQADTSYALFTNDSWKVSDQVELTLGLRYTSEKKSMTGYYTNSDGGAGCGAALAKYQQAATLYAANSGNALAAIGAGANQYWIGAIVSGPGTVNTLIGALCPFWANPNFSNRSVSDSHDESNLSGTLKAAWHVNENVMIYGSYARGYKAGGYNLDRAQTGVTPDSSLWFPAETVDSYELGAKTILFDKALTLNVTAFDQRFKDFQLNTFLGTAFVVESIPELTSKGFDADIYWRTPIKGLSVQGGVSYADTKYGNFTKTQLLNPSHFDQLSLLPGAQMSFAPKWTSSAAITWTGTTFGLRTSANLTAKYTSDYNTGSDLIPFKAQSSYTLYNGRIAIGPENRSWTLELWGQNLGNVKYKQVVINAPLQGSAFVLNPSGVYSAYSAATDTNTYDAFMGTPRTYGATLRVRY